MDVATLKRKLRDLRQLERRFRGVGEGHPLVWDDYFTTREGGRARYPLKTLSVFDRESRRAVFTRYLSDVFATSLSLGSPSGRPQRLRVIHLLGLAEDASDEAIVRRFRERAKELHPDLGGDADAMVELLNHYTAMRAADRA